MRTNVATPKIKTHEGGTAKHINPLQQLRRSVMACLLWESEFYESGVEIGERIALLVPQCKPADVHAIAIEARTVMHLRHAPLWLLRCCLNHAEHRKGLAPIIEQVILRADEPAELLAMYFKDGRKPLPWQLRHGLDRALRKFNEYALAKYDRDGTVKLRDVFRLVHPKPVNDEQAALWKLAVNRELATPVTWEVELSKGGDKKETWTRLLTENKLGGFALIRNLRNMTEAGVDDALIRPAILNMDVNRILPFRFIAAARYAPRFERELEAAMFRSSTELRRLPGLTTVLVDVSGSMDTELSGKSEMTRIDAACGVAMVCSEVCESVRVFTFSDRLVEVPPRRGFALRDAIKQSQPHQSTLLGAAIKGCDQGGRLIVITDEQSADKTPDPKGNGWIINVASARNGVGYGTWNRVDGFSDGVVRYIAEFERGD